MTDDRTTYTSGGNYNEHIGGNYVQGDFYAAPSDFFEPNLKRFESDDISPTVTPELLEVVKKQRLLVLSTRAGGATINIHNLALHLAYRLTKELDEQGNNSDNAKISVKQWRRNSEPESIDTILTGNVDQTTIFVLTEASPENLGYNLSRIQESASDQHYVIASTDKPINSWKLPSMPEYWRELSVDGLYKLSDLETVLCREIERLREQGTLAPQLQKGELELNKTIIGNWSLLKIVQSLKTPENITRFLQFLCAEKQPLAQEVIERLIHLAQGQENTLKQWYEHILKPREQLLALGLSFFDGLHENQIFAALDILVEQAWRQRDPSLSHFDRSDLNNLLNFFKVIKDEEKEDLARIKSVLPQQRRWLFKWAWDSHRQQLRAALPVIAKIIKNSVAERDSDLELYRDKIQRKQLRTTISESLSEIGCISYSGIEKTLLQLAADQDMGVQLVAASAMARWREPDYHKSDKELFDTLKLWLDTSSTRPLIRQLNDILEDDDENKDDNGKKAKASKPEDYLRSTVALTVGYASLYDQPKNSRNSSSSAGLSPILSDLLKTLSHHTDPLVRHRFLNETLRRVVRLHLVQLHDWLHSLIQQNTNDIELQNAVGTSLASAYRVNPQLVIKLLNYWRKECEQYRSALVDKEIVTPYEAMLATIARTYGKIKCDQHLTQQEIIKHLSSMFTEEKHPFVRAAILQAMKKQGNEYEAEHKMEEDLQNLEEEMKKHSTNDTSPNPIPTGSGLKDLYISLIVPWLAIALSGVYYIVFKRNYCTRLVRERLYYQQVISGILPEVLGQNFSNLSAKSFVLDRFQNEKYEKLMIILDLLKPSLWLAKNPGWVIFGSLALMLIFR